VLRSSGGQTNLSAAIAAIRTQMFVSSAGSRPGVAKIAVIFVDGQSISEAEAVREAILARQAGITLLIVGISATNTQLSEWLGVASFPSTLNVFNVPEYNTLPTIVSRLITSIDTGLCYRRIFNNVIKCQHTSRSVSEL